MNMVQRLAWLAVIRFILPEVGVNRHLNFQPGMCSRKGVAGVAVLRLQWIFVFVTAALLRLAGSCPAKNELSCIAMFPANGMVRAEVYVRTVSYQPVAALVLCPGCNGKGDALLRDERWLRFAESNKLALFGLSFASELPNLKDGTGYYYASAGSGKILLDVIDSHSKVSLPVFIYGFSGGAHFASRFVEWNPRRVRAWCAYSAGWWDTPKKMPDAPPGMVACGDLDPRLGASLTYFKQGRAIGRPWLWMQIPDNGHSPEGRVEDFIREYFAEVLSKSPLSLGDGVWMDIDTKIPIAPKLSAEQPTLTGWLPSKDLIKSWSEIHGFH